MRQQVCCAVPGRTGSGYNCSSFNPRGQGWGEVRAHGAMEPASRQRKWTNFSCFEIGWQQQEDTLSREEKTAAQARSLFTSRRSKLQDTCRVLSSYSYARIVLHDGWTLRWPLEFGWFFQATVSIFWPSPYLSSAALISLPLLPRAPQISPVVCEWFVTPSSDDFWWCACARNPLNLGRSFKQSSSRLLWTFQFQLLLVSLINYCGNLT